MYTLFYYPLNASLAPHIVLEHLGIDFELTLVDRKQNAQKKEEYLKLNPLGRIPTLINNEQAIFESPAICMHLAETHPEAKLLPAVGSPDRATCIQWLMYLTNTLQSELVIYFYPERYLSNEAEIVKLKASQERRITDCLAILDNELANKKYLSGEHVSISDYYLFMLAIWADEIPKPPLSFSNLSNYLKKLSLQPAVIKACKTEGFSLSDYH